MEGNMYNILVCDDDKDIVEAIDIYLSKEGYNIIKAYDGMEAMEILKKEDIQLLLIDVMMPRLDGIRATLKIREENNIPIITRRIPPAFFNIFIIFITFHFC